MTSPSYYTATMQVDRYLHGVRIDSFLEKHFRNYSSWRLMRQVREGLVRIDGEVALPTSRVRREQKVEITLIEPPDEGMTPEEIPFEVVFEDDYLLVVNKPPGLIIHPTGEIPLGTLANALQHYLNSQSAFPGLLRPGLVHRLDQDTSGLVATCKDHLSHRELSLEFQNERVSKSYLAIVHGVIPDDEGMLSWPIGRNPRTRATLMSCRGDALEARPSKTIYRVIERFPQHTLVKVTPRSGRMHQIRIHLATHGYPLLGDECYTYGGEILPAPDRSDPPISPLIPRQALHACELAFSHPITKEWMTFQANPPADFVLAREQVAVKPGETFNPDD